MVKNVLIVVPYRDREEHLEKFLKAAPKYFNTQNITYDILICELDSEGDWNAGLCCNSLINFVKDKQYEYIYIHHVDIYPIEGDISFPNQNEYYFNIGDYGSCIVSYKNFIKAGGYSNLFWGWGGEDNDLYQKLNSIGLVAIDKNENFIKFNLEDQKHPRIFNGKNYANAVKLIFTDEFNRKDIDTFYENAYIKDFSKIDNNIYKQIVHPLNVSANQAKNKKVLLGYIKNKQNPKELMPFLKTGMMFASYEYDIAICIADENPDEYLLNQIEAFGAIPYVVSSEDDNICIDRYYAYKKFITEHPQYTHVLHTDVTDVIFQTNPFKFIKDDLIISSEGIQIKNETWNTNSLKGLYSNVIYNIIKDKNVLCGGVIGGPVDKFILLCNLIIQENKILKIRKKDLWGIDQLIIQKLIYIEGLDIKILKHDSKFAVNLHVISNNKSLYTNIKIINNKKVFYIDSPFSVVHQYNRFIELFNNVQNFYEKSFCPL